MSTKKTTKELYAEARSKDLFFESPEKESSICEFIACEKFSVMHLEGFHVCVNHGFRLIECLTEKMKNDNINNDEEN